jgi:hypothetical protein
LDWSLSRRRLTFNVRPTFDMCVSPQKLTELALRVVGAVAGAALTISCSLGLAISAGMMSAYSTLSSTERDQMAVLNAAMLIPLMVGVLGIIGPRHRWVRYFGALLCYVLSPLCLIALLLSGMVPARSEEAFWMSVYVVVAAGYWLLLTSHRFGISTGPSQ